MPAVPVIPVQRHLVLDTGPLWELILYSAVHSRGIESLRPNLQHLQSDSSYQKLSRFIASFPKRTTTAYVIAEISAHIIRTKHMRKPELWGLVYSEFSSMGMGEEILRLLELRQELVAEIGAVDASILSMGKKIGQRESLVLSIDFPLVRECKRAGVEAMHLTEVTEGID
jgi:hypothetical protein